MTEGIRLSHAEFARILRRAGYTPEQIQVVAAQLPDPIDADRDRQILDGYGITRGHLMELMGASP
jgi:hypothetical protein